MATTMGTTRLLTFAFLLFPFSLVSCQSKDAERLAALGTRLREKAQGLVASGGGPLRGLQSVPLRLGELSVDARVLARLQWDKGLADAVIEVHAVGDSAVELTGKVRDMDAKRRALELAQTTAGVEKVMDKMEIGQ